MGASPTPSFPTPFVTEKVYQLGYGTGPWPRDRFVELWGAPSADKFVRDAKETGWLVSPERGVYYVPPAVDLMTVSWLGPALRKEYQIARTLGSRELKFWCLSAWCREQGLDLGGPIFVTDLSRGTGSTIREPAPTPVRRDGKQHQVYRPAPLAERRGAARERAKRTGHLPFLDNLLIVPEMPTLHHPPERKLFLAPVSPEAEDTAQMEQTLMGGVSSLIALGAGLITKAWSGMQLVEDVLQYREKARGIPYALGPDLHDHDWILALLAALGIARAEELALRLAKKGPVDQMKVKRDVALLGPPEPNSDWASTITEGPFPYLLVPPLLWRQMGADQAARRARTLDRLLE